MLENLTQAFKNVANKIRFSDDERALNTALADLKKIFLKNDVHHKTTKILLQNIQNFCKNEENFGKNIFINALQDSLTQILKSSKNYGLHFAPHPPTVLFLVGLQGAGKTTTAAKLALYMKNKGKKVLLCACDTQRLAAITQLRTLGQEIDVEVFFDESAPDPENIAKNAVQRAKDGDFDAVIIDTAGRLAIDERLMSELKSMKNALQPHEILYVADSLSGQEGVRNIEHFNATLDLTGVILSKFDSDTKGGIALNIAHHTGLPLRFIGTGERVFALDIFLPDRVVSRLLGAGDIATLAEKTSAIMDEKQAKNLAQKVKKGSFTFTDFLEQIENVKKLGSMSSIMGMIPGLSALAPQLKNMDLENAPDLKNMRAMVNSMTQKERDDPKILNAQRRRRIAAGAGLQISDVNRVIKNFENTAKMAKKFTKNGGNIAQILKMNTPKFPQK